MAELSVAQDAHCCDERLYAVIAKIVYENSGEIYAVTHITKANVHDVETGLKAVCELAGRSDRYGYYKELYEQNYVANGSLMRWWNFADCTMVLTRMDGFDESARGAGATEIDKQDVFVKRRGVFAPIVGAPAQPVYINPHEQKPGRKLVRACEERWYPKAL
jgi:hypothetical protein